MRFPGEDTLSRFDTVSFDIFDTLVRRPFMEPTEVFGYIENRFSAEGFRKARVKAERESRRGKDRDVTLDEIYSCLPGKFRHLKDAECKTEIRVCRPDPHMSCLAKKLKSQGKRVVFTSDMYLPRNVVEGIVDNCGYSDVCDRLFLSSDTGDTKYNGRLFKTILKELELEPSELAHVGDNRHSDHDVPTSMGISAYLCTEESSKRRPLPVVMYQNMTSSVLCATYRLVPESENDWYSLGWRFGGPLLSSYVSFLEKNRDPDSKVLYVARDGYPVMEYLGKKGVDGSYVHAQRIMALSLSEDVLPYDSLPQMSHALERRNRTRDIRTMLRFMGFGDVDEGDDATVMKNYGDRIEEVGEVRRKAMERFSSDLHRECGDKPVELADCTTMKYTSQRFVEEALGRSVTGNYVVTLRECDDLRYRSMHSKKGPMLGWNRVNFPEFFFCSPETPLKGWSDGPVYDDDPPGWEKERAENFGDLLRGMIDYSREMDDMFPDGFPEADYRTLADWSILSRGKFGYPDIIRRMKWASDPDHGEWNYLSPRPSEFPTVVKRLATGAANWVFRW